MNALERQALSDSLNASLARYTNTIGGDLVEGLYYELDAADKPKYIKGYLLEPTLRGGMRRQATTWLPSGRHRLRESLNLPIAQ